MLPIIIDEEEEEEEDLLYFEVNVFPLQEAVRFPITPSVEDNRRGSINIAAIYDYARRVLSELADGAEDAHPMATILYGVEVLYATTTASATVKGKKKTEKRSVTRKLAGASLAEYGLFLDAKLSKKLLKRINNEDRDLPYPVLISSDKSFVGARVILFPAPRDVAHHFYSIPPLPSSMGYEITIYRDTPTELGQLQEYIDEVYRYNNKLPLLLPFPVAMDTQQFPALSRIIFIARRGEKVIGYCGCTILPYRLEVVNQLDQAMSDAMKDFSPSKPVEATIQERYFMGVKPANIFEIEGLSASPYEARNNVGLALIYEALRFIREPVMTRLYPVTHIVSQAASYITKRLLVANFHFRYHGTNEFMNEGFVEIIATKRLVDTLTELLRYYIMFMGSAWMVDHFSQSTRNQKPVITTMLSNVVKLYQLYYLILKWERTGASPSSKNSDTLGALIRLFKLFGRVLPHGSLIGKYFDEARHALESYAKDAKSVMDTLDATIVWNDGNTLAPKYGFMVAAKEVKGKPSGRREKIPYTQGYDVIYSVLPNISEISGFVDQEVKALMTVLLQPINELVLKDLALLFNYELPLLQLQSIASTLTAIIEKDSMAAENQTLQEILGEVENKIVLMDKNTDFNYAFGAFYLLPKSPCDCYISFALLEKEWVDTEKRLLVKFGASPEVKEKPHSLLLSLADTMPLALPTTREQLFGQINVLYELIWPNADRQSLDVSYNGARYTIATLLDHFNTLMSMENTIGVVIEILDSDEQSLGEMEVEGAHVGYRLEDFIDDDEEDVTENVLNKALI